MSYRQNPSEYPQYQKTFSTQDMIQIMGNFLEDTDLDYTASHQQNLSAAQSQSQMAINNQETSQKLGNNLRYPTTVYQPPQPQSYIYQDLRNLIGLTNFHNDRIRHLENELYNRKQAEQTIIPDHIIKLSDGMGVCLGSATKYMLVTNFHIIDTFVIIFPEPIEKENYYLLELLIVNEHRNVSILLPENEFRDYKRFKNILFKHGCCVMSAKGKADEKKVLSLLTDCITQNSKSMVITQVLAGWTPKEGLAANEINKYRGIELSDEILACFGINRKRLILVENPNVETIRGFEKVFTNEKIYYFLMALHIYSIVKNQLLDGLKASLKKILNLKGDINLCKEIAMLIFKIFNRDDMNFDCTTSDSIDKIDELLLHAKDEAVIVRGFDKTSSRNEKNNFHKRLQYLENVLCNETPIRDRYKTTASCVLIFNSASDEIDSVNLFQIHIDGQVINEKALTEWKLSAPNFYDLDSLLIKHINLVNRSFYDDIIKHYSTQMDSSELKGIFKNNKTKEAYIVLSYMLKIYRDAIMTIDENEIHDDDFYADCIKEVLLSNEEYQGNETNSSSESVLFLFKEALTGFIESKSCNIVEIDSNDIIDPDKHTIYHDDKYFYVKEHVFKENICKSMEKTVSGREMLNILKENKFLSTNNGSCLTYRKVINGERSYYVAIDRSFIDVRGNISCFD